MSWKRLEDIFARRLQDVLKTFLQDFLITFWRRLEDILPRRLEGVLKMSWGRFQNVLKTSWRCLENIFPRRLEDVLKTYDQDEYIGLDQDILRRHMTKANIFVLIKTSWRRLEDVFWSRIRKTSWRTSSEAEDERRLPDIFKRLHQDKCLPGENKTGKSLTQLSYYCFD